MLLFPARRFPGTRRGAQLWLGTCAQMAHPVLMSDPLEYRVSLTDLVDGVRVALDEQVQEQDSERTEHDDSAGHLPGNVRPYGA